MQLLQCNIYETQISQSQPTPPDNALFPYEVASGYMRDLIEKADGISDEMRKGYLLVVSLIESSVKNAKKRWP